MQFSQIVKIYKKYLKKLLTIAKSCGIIIKLSRRGQHRKKPKGRNLKLSNQNLNAMSEGDEAGTRKGGPRR